MVAEPSEARSRGKRRPTSAAASWASARVSPASATITSSSRSMSRTARSRSVESRISPCGIWPPTRPVLPPWGVTATPASAQIPITAATWAVLPGRARSGVVSAPAVAPFHELRGQPVGIVAPATAAEDLLQSGQHFFRDGRGHVAILGRSPPKWEPVRRSANAPVYEASANHHHPGDSTWMAFALGAERGGVIPRGPRRGAGGR